MSNRNHYHKLVPIACGVLLIGLLIFLRGKSIGDALRDGVVRGLYPVIRGVAPVVRVWQAQFSGSARRAEDSLSERARAELEKLRDENAELRNILRLSRGHGTLDGAEVLRHGHELGKEFLIINKGTKEGVRQNQLVADADRVLVGVVKEAGEYTARVDVASNIGRVFEVEILPLGVRALAKGVGGRGFLVELIPADVPVRQGDFIVLASYQDVRISLLLGAIRRQDLGGNATFISAGATLLAKPQDLAVVFLVSP